MGTENQLSESAEPVSETSSPTQQGMDVLATLLKAIVQENKILSIRMKVAEQSIQFLAKSLDAFLNECAPHLCPGTLEKLKKDLSAQAEADAATTVINEIAASTQHKTGA